ncbi:Aldo/keto reductase [Hymenopellis radicata]|nr:Aldo/keto reductase [Hymenopellis radicata]
MSIGDKWEKYGYGSMDKESSFKLLDAYFGNGGNFIDSANNYQDETSEKFIGEWAEKRGIRDQLVLTTKVGTHGTIRLWLRRPATSATAQIHDNLLNASLAKLRTTYIDIFYLHWWDFRTSVEEVMNSLHNLVVQGKVLYLGISDTPAWVVAQANTYAKAHGKTPFCIYQGHWNLLDRSFEREIIPMARSLGLALAPWDVLGGGKFMTDAEEEARAKSGEKGRAINGLRQSWQRNDAEKTISAALEKVAKEVGTTNVRAVAVAYVMQKTPYVFPTIGGRKVEHMLSNIEALEISLTPEHIAYLESVVPFDVGFPNNLIGDGSAPNSFTMTSIYTAQPPAVAPIRP